MVAALGYFLCRRRNYAGVALALMAGYWAYNSLSFMFEFRSEVVRQVGMGYAVHACLALLLPFAAMAFGLCGRRTGAERRASPNGGPTEPLGNSGVGSGPPSVS